jgi:hypothetical protein
MNKIKRNKDQVSMDAINSWLVALHTLIENDVALNVEDQEHLEAVLYGNISEHLERFFNYPDYNNYN